MKRRQFMKRISVAALGGSLISGKHANRALAAGTVDLEKYRAASLKRWDAEITRMEMLNKTEEHPASSILFIGSSSIRRWNTIAEDISPYHPIQRGFGGSQWSDVAVFAERLIEPHQFRAAAFFVGNDVSGRENDKTPEEVAGLFTYVLGKVRQHNSQAPVFYISVTPTPSRFAVWPEIKAANSAARAVCSSAPNTYFIGTESVFLDGNGKPRSEFFVEDQLHLNQDGYQRWAAIIKSHLDTVLDGAG